MREYHVALSNSTTGAFVGNYVISTTSEENAIIGAIQEALLFSSGHYFSASVYYVLPNGVNSQSKIVTHQTIS